MIGLPVISKQNDESNASETPLKTVVDNFDWSETPVRAQVALVADLGGAGQRRDRFQAAYVPCLGQRSNLDLQRRVRSDSRLHTPRKWASCWPETAARFLTMRFDSGQIFAGRTSVLGLATIIRSPGAP